MFALRPVFSGPWRRCSGRTLCPPRALGGAIERVVEASLPLARRGLQQPERVVYLHDGTPVPLPARGLGTRCSRQADPG